MMILRFAPASPFVRKVRIAAALLGLTDEIELKLTDPTKPDDAFWRDNPLGKIPVLIGEDGAEYYDSRVIVDYLDHRAGGGKIIPRDGAARFAVLRMQALGDGINDAVAAASLRRSLPASRQAGPELARSSGRQGRARARRARSSAAPAYCAARCRADRARLRARLSRPAVQGQLAEGPPEAGGLARPVRRQGAVVRRKKWRRKFARQ